MNQIFVSYARTDSATVEAIVNRLRRRGIRLWMDKTSISGGQNWEQAIRQAINISDALLVFLSPDSTSREWVNIEINEALDMHKPVVPYRLEETELPLRLKSINFIDHKSPDAFDALVSALSKASPASVYSGESEFIKSGWIGKSDKTFQDAAAVMPDGVKPIEPNRTNLIGLPLEPTAYCSTYLVGRALDKLTWQPKIQLALQMTQDYEGADFPVKIARCLEIRKAANLESPDLELRMLLIRGPLQLATTRDRGVILNHGLDNNAPEEWSDAVQATLKALKHYCRNSERPKVIQFFAFAPAALTGAIGITLERGWGVEFYNFTGGDTLYSQVFTLPSA
jgi:hypothetical protein